jgi:hypothetical protein
MGTQSPDLSPIFFPVSNNFNQMRNAYNWLIAIGAGVGAILFGYEVGVIG